MIRKAQRAVTCPRHVLNGRGAVRPLTDQTGPVRAEGKIIHAGRQIATSEGRLFGPDGKLYAHGTTTCMIFDLPKEQVKGER